MQTKSSKEAVMLKIDSLIEEANLLVQEMFIEKSENEKIRWKGNISPAESKSKYSKKLKKWIDKCTEYLSLEFASFAFADRFHSRCENYVIEKHWYDIQKEVLKKKAILQEYSMKLSSNLHEGLTYNDADKCFEYRGKRFEYKKDSLKRQLCSYMFSQSVGKVMPIKRIFKAIKGREPDGQKEEDTILNAAKNVNQDIKSRFGLSVFSKTPEGICIQIEEKKVEIS